jgi:hypothetical protein
MKVKVESSQNVTPEQVVAAADNVWKVVKRERRRFSLKRNEPLETQLSEQIRSKYSDFTNSYPAVYRYMSDLGIYSSKVLLKYLKWLQARQATSHEEFVDGVVEYPVMLVESGVVNCEISATEYRNRMRSAMIEEHKRMKEAAAAASEKTEERDKARSMALAAKLAEFVQTAHNLVPVYSVKAQKQIIVDAGQVADERAIEREVEAARGQLQFLMQ